MSNGVRMLAVLATLGSMFVVGTACEIIRKGGHGHDDDMARACTNAAARQYDVGPSHIALRHVKSEGGGYSISGHAVQKRYGAKKFTCIFNKHRKLKNVESNTSEGKL